MKRLLPCYLLLFVFVLHAFPQNDYFDAQNYKNKRVAERLFNMAVDAVNAKDYYGALFFLDSVTRLQPNLAAAYIERGKIYYVKERKQDALSEFQQVLSFEPNNGEAQFYKDFVNFTIDTGSVSSADFDQVIRNNYTQP